MRLRNKLFIFIITCWIAFLVITYTFAIYNSLIGLSLLAGSFAIVMILAINHIVSKRIELMNREMSSLNPTEDLRTTHITSTGNDDITTLAAQLNELLNTMQLSRESFERKVSLQTQNLQKASLQLQYEILDRKSSESESSNHDAEKAKTKQYDHLTALPNRIFFNEILNKSISHAARHQKVLAIILVDVDSFKNMNVKYGKTNGDLILKEIGKRLANTLRGDDIIAKLDGDEFIILLNDIAKPKFASMVAEKILKILSQPIHVDAQSLTISASIGICIYPNDGNSLEELLDNVDKALFKVKQTKPGTYQFFTHDMDVEARDYIQLDSALRKAIHNNELTLFFQPILHIKRGTIIGVEALMRWSHPALGLISPDKFIPHAEEAGLMMKIGEWTLFEACKINKHWQNEGYTHMTMSVNLSLKQFYHPDIVSIINNALKETGLNPQYLALEITEKTVMADVNNATEILEQIKSTGARIYIDHFGTGYTSISHLKQLPISVLKIDHSFIKGLPNIPNDMSVTNAFIGLAHNLGLEVVAEGVETAAQVQYLTENNCDMIQGYFLTHPLPAQKIELQFNKLTDQVLL